MANTLVGASSATYRTAVNKVAKAIKRKPRHTRYPSKDLDDIVRKIPGVLDQEIIKWYKLGVKRGMRKATDLMAENAIYKKGEAVYAPDDMMVKVRVRIAGKPWKKVEIHVKPKQIGFK
ncbi:MAG: hypothetical protein N838_18735 [Thiohalocapsa sp. PB-PSB1]|nr:MAG: hypothetical protein N838_18735 [Thiohalocapsa sp. PB-PSB1]